MTDPTQFALFAGASFLASVLAGAVLAVIHNTRRH
jgi:hypothetical protein